jgi:hypothetical protein
MICAKSNTNTPYVKLDIDNGNLTIIGKSYPEHPDLFYEPILAEIEQRKDQFPNSRFTITVALEIMNSVSAKYVFRVLREVCELATEIKILWYHEEDDESMLDEGDIFKQLLPNSDFVLIPVLDLRTL